MSLNLGLLNMIVKLYLNSIFLLCFVNLYSMDDSAAERTVQTGSMRRRVFNIFTKEYEYMSSEAFEKYNEALEKDKQAKAEEAEEEERDKQRRGTSTPPPGGGSRRKKRGNTKRRKTKKRKGTKKTKRRKFV